MNSFNSVNGFNSSNKMVKVSYAIPANASIETLWDLYNMTVVELHNLEKKLEKAEKSHQTLVDVVSTSDEDEVLYLADKVAARCTKLKKLHGLVINAQRNLESLRLKVTAKIRVASEVGVELEDYLDEIEGVSECEGMLEAYGEMAAGLGLELKQVSDTNGLGVLMVDIEHLLYDVKDIEIDYPMDLEEHIYLKDKFNEIIEELMELKRKVQDKQFMIAVRGLTS